MASHISCGHSDLIFGEPTEHEGSMTLRNVVKHHPQYITHEDSIIIQCVTLPSFIRQHYDIRSYRVWCRVVWYTVTKVSEEPAVIIFGSEHFWMVTEFLNYPFKAHCSLYLPQGLKFINSTFCPHDVFMCSVWIWEQTEILSLYSINWAGFYNRHSECLLCGTDWIFSYNSSLKGQSALGSTV
jgi:hypothetical protein